MTTLAALAPLTSLALRLPRHLAEVIPDPDLPVRIDEQPLLDEIVAEGLRVVHRNARRQGDFRGGDRPRFGSQGERLRLLSVEVRAELILPELVGRLTGVPVSPTTKAGAAVTPASWA